MFKSVARENRALVASAAMAAFFAVSGIGWGLWIDSLVIVFDGAYSLMSLGLSLLSLYAARLVRRPASARYPFGMGAVEPLVIAFKGLVIGLVCLISLVSAAVALMQGGRPVGAGMAMLFGAVSVVGCLLIWAYLVRASNANNSGLIQAERRQWLMDSALSAAVLIGFACAWMQEHSQWSALAVYADPLMMLVISLYFIRVPVRMVRDAIKELLLAAPNKEAIDDIKRTLAAQGFKTEGVKVAKSGPHLLLEAKLIKMV